MIDVALNTPMGGKANSAYNGPRLLVDWTTLNLIRCCPMASELVGKNWQALILLSLTKNISSPLLIHFFSLHIRIFNRRPLHCSSDFVQLLFQLLLLFYWKSKLSQFCGWQHPKYVCGNCSKFNCTFRNWKQYWHWMVPK